MGVCGVWGCVCVWGGVCVCVLKMLRLVLIVPTYFDGFSWHLGKRILE